MRKFWFAILCVSLFSCGKKKEGAPLDPIKISKPAANGAEASDYDAQFKLENYLVSEQTDTSKVQVINFDCAVFIYPTHEQVEEMKKTEGEDFYVSADDANFYQTQAIQVIDSVGIKTAGTEKRFIKFEGSDGIWTVDIRKKNLPAWNLILFKKDKTPLPTPAINVTSDLVKEYFDKEP